jgi:hypothetical protein
MTWAGRPFRRGLRLHALTDAVLGAIADGDIGDIPAPTRREGLPPTGS